jgi:hypothetical protein
VVMVQLKAATVQWNTATARNTSESWPAIMYLLV